MFDIGYGELLLIAIVALLVLGPDKLPGALRTAGLWISRLRRSFDRMRSEIEQEVGADDIRRQIHNEMMLDQAREIRREIEAAARNMKDGLQAPIAELPASRSAALAQAASTASTNPGPATATATGDPAAAATTTIPVGDGPVGDGPVGDGAIAAAPAAPPDLPRPHGTP